MFCNMFSRCSFMSCVTKLAAAAALLVTLGSTANAAFTVNYSNGTQFDITGALTGFSTDGSEMAGMQVTAFFAGGGSETRTWATTGVGSGGVTGTTWSLGETGNTFTGTWTFAASTPISQLYIDAPPGKTVFDVIASAENTPGSGFGTAFSSVTGDVGYQVNATYRNIVSLNNVNFGDLYGLLDIAFINNQNPAAGYTGTLRFVSDTDNATAGSDIVPEPSMVMLLSAAGMGLAFYGYRRRSK